MQIHIPPEAEELVRARATAAGFSDVSHFVLQRALCDDEDLAAMDVAASDPRAAQLILDGLNSGPATPMTEDDWHRLRDDVRQRLHENNSMQ